jgi:hypothetical protein
VNAVVRVAGRKEDGLRAAPARAKARVADAIVVIVDGSVGIIEGGRLMN